ncbi:flagellar basal body rod protein FlgC [Sulfitobacter sp. LCG007]
MSDFNNSLNVSASGLKAQATRLRHLSENISNADTPGYRRKTISFRTAFDANRDVEMVETSKVHLDRRDLERIYDPSHPMADEDGYFEGSNVDLMIEIGDAREAQRSYEANLKMFEMARKMSGGLMDLLRK